MVNAIIGVGAAVGELAAQGYNAGDTTGVPKADTVAFAQMMAGIAGAIVGGDAQSVGTAAITGANAAQNNAMGLLAARAMGPALEGLGLAAESTNPAGWVLLGGTLAYASCTSNPACNAALQGAASALEETAQQAWGTIVAHVSGSHSVALAPSSTGGGAVGGGYGGGGKPQASGPLTTPADNQTGSGVIATPNQGPQTSTSPDGYQATSPSDGSAVGGGYGAGAQPSSGSVIYSQSGGDDTANSLPTDASQLSHIFRDDIGHLTATPENQKTLLNLVNNPQNLLGTDKYGNQWYAQTLSDGTQLWGSVRNGVLQNGGLNATPKTYNPTTGLSKAK